MSHRTHLLMIGAVGTILLAAALAGTTKGLTGYFMNNQASLTANNASEQTTMQTVKVQPAVPSNAELGTISTEPPDTEVVQPTTPLIPTPPASVPSGCVYVHNSSTCIRDCSKQFWPDSICNPCTSIHPLSERVCYVAE